MGHHRDGDALINKEPRGPLRHSDATLPTPSPILNHSELLTAPDLQTSPQNVKMSEVPADLKVEYRQLGKSGLRISVPVFGCMSFGDPQIMNWAIGEDEALPLLKAAYDRGLTSWDTANVYSHGESESIIGKAIKKYAIPRNRLVIMTKCFNTVQEGPQRGKLSREDIAACKEYQNQGGLSRAAIFNQVEASLQRLDTSYIDLLQIHRFDSTVPVEETMKALHDLVQSGKVRYIGASSMWATQFARMQFAAERNGWTLFISMQNHYNLLYREEEREMNRFCNDTGVGLIPWAPLCRGHLARKPEVFGTTLRSKAEKDNPVRNHGTVEPDLTIIKRVEEIANKHGWPVSSDRLSPSNNFFVEILGPPILGATLTKAPPDVQCRPCLDQSKGQQSHHWLQ